VRKILSIDGGGIRGIIPAMVLATIEERTGRPIAQLFDLIAGTSTGGILALGLVKPTADGQPQYSADDLVELYETEGRAIFYRDAWHRVTALGNLLEEKWPSKGVDSVLSSYFGETNLSKAICEVLVTSYDIEARTPYFFKRHRALTDKTKDWPMRLAARATSAAPTYFEPALLDLPGRDKLALIDGGVFANNPAMCGYVEATKLWHDETRYLVLSLGTGELTRSIPYDQAKSWGLAKWAQPLLGVVFDGVSDAVDHQLQQLCTDEQSDVDDYLRLQVALTEANDDMDDATQPNMEALKRHAKKLITERDDDIRHLCEVLAER
jgi:uncharacterized protein